MIQLQPKWAPLTPSILEARLGVIWGLLAPPLPTLNPIPEVQVPALIILALSPCDCHAWAGGGGLPSLPDRPSVVQGELGSKQSQALPPRAQILPNLVDIVCSCIPDTHVQTCGHTAVRLHTHPACRGVHSSCTEAHVYTLHQNSSKRTQLGGVLLHTGAPP